MLVFTIVMLGVHVVGTPAIYAYLFFWKHQTALTVLQEQELDEYHQARNTVQQRLEKQGVQSEGLEKHAQKLLPGYMIRLTSGYEYRTYWFELFECMRKVLIVGVPSTFPERGGTAQLFVGLLVCFTTFGAYMLYAPFVEDSDDFLSQLAQMQIFLTLLSSLALRTIPPSKIVGDLITVILFLVPCLGFLLETPLLGFLVVAVDKLPHVFSRVCPGCKPPKIVPDLRPSHSHEATEAPDASSVTVTEL